MVRNNHAVRNNHVVRNNHSEKQPCSGTHGFLPDCLVIFSFITPVLKLWLFLDTVAQSLESLAKMKYFRHAQTHPLGSASELCEDFPIFKTECYFHYTFVN